MGLPPSNGTSVVVAKIIEVYDERLEIHPCSEVACVALVKLEKVKKRSSGFTSILDENQEGDMRFAFTLAETTKALFPNLDKRFPGLEEGDRFEANIKEELLLGSGKTRWVAYEYILLN